MRYFILIWVLGAICSMTPLERTVPLEHEGCDSVASAIDVGGGNFMTAGHCLDTDCTLMIGGKPMTVKDFSMSPDWAVIYNPDFTSPDVTTAQIVEGEICWYWKDGRRFPVVFYEHGKRDGWLFYGHPPAKGVSGTGIFNTDDALVAIITDRYPGNIYKFSPSGMATPVLGLITSVEPPKVQTPAPPKPN